MKQQLQYMNDCSLYLKSVTAKFQNCLRGAAQTISVANIPMVPACLPSGGFVSSRRGQGGFDIHLWSNFKDGLY
ncbi:hypothetical protein DPMN_022257 [Dreissena polymorpha]|uniref:Uncharacterized protein n=2 Tax=Dreissena polymorpha TaxID=45954 RepID=A0A9D4NP42_DREPO|nr:hypothetical protein DPMN_022257 [Dreissena polymorpha]